MFKKTEYNNRYKLIESYAIDCNKFNKFKFFCDICSLFSLFIYFFYYKFWPLLIIFVIGRFYFGILSYFAGIQKFYWLHNKRR